MINVNQRVAGSVGTAVMSVILTNQFNRSQNVTTANRMAALQEQAAQHGTPLNPSLIPPRALAPDFMSHVMHDLSHAYAEVFIAVAMVAALSYIPAWFVPRKPVHDEGQTPAPAMAG